MKSKLLHRDSAGAKTYALVFETGDEVIGPLTRFAGDNALDAAHFTAIGAFSDATLAYFDWEKKDYTKIPVREQVEVLTLSGDISTDEKTRKPKVHAHVVLGKSDASAVGGHLVEAHVRPTLEVVLIESPAHLQRRHDEQTGLALIRL